MSLVLDSSATLAWLFDDERTEAVRKLLDRVTDRGALVPDLWRYEVANGLQMAVRRKRINQAYRDRALSNLADLAIRTDADSGLRVWSHTVQLASVHHLTVYDAAYLELPQRRALPLATLDAALAQAGRAVGLQLLPL